MGNVTTNSPRIFRPLPEDRDVFATSQSRKSDFSLTDALRNFEHLALARNRARHVQRDTFSVRLPLDPNEGSGYWDCSRLNPEVYVVVANFSYHEVRTEVVPGDDHLISFCFNLGGDCTADLGDSVLLRSGRPMLLVWRRPEGHYVKEWTAARSKERCVVINVHRRFLAEKFFLSTADLSPPLSVLLAAGIPKLQYHELPLTPRMLDRVSCLLEDSEPGPLGLILTEAVALELLCLAVSALQALNPQAEPRRQRISRDRGLQAARALLEQQVSSPPTIRQLARSVGMSETNLKRGFKELFGETVYDCSLRCRMQRARVLLRQGQTSVAQVAAEVGYSHSNSFAAAFRRQFGISPLEARWIQDSPGMPADHPPQA